MSLCIDPTVSLEVKYCVGRPPQDEVEMYDPCGMSFERRGENEEASIHWWRVDTNACRSGMVREVNKGIRYRRA